MLAVLFCTLPSAVIVVFLLSVCACFTFPLCMELGVFCLASVARCDLSGGILAPMAAVPSCSNLWEGVSITGHRPVVV